ncbi:MAG: hypothetical protein Tp125SUR00d2C35697761_16 [Prokaryotic dsDNA virus sp.]|nr:MAG: hypothetical protein Tp125SUR00d2C35697761_16 [Prokaryotic dsDNA virus sp.]QDP66055.1 MAG: hypothetical protein Unbinned4336contig1000_20 [Prokaryotic dsDNA virus sp.]|tara:strand:- start:30452 stop:30622 length:171 start_codon:yes stop_codon:yes gene_type:complete
MFGKEQPEITDERDVGDYITMLQQQGKRELQMFLSGEEDEVGGDSIEPTSGREDSD